MRRLLALLLLPVLLLTACGGGGENGDSADATPAKKITDLSAIEVTGAAGQKPKVEIGGSFSTDKTAQRVLTEGTGPAVQAGQALRIDYLGVNGRDGKDFDASFGNRPATFILDEKSVIKGFADGLVGAKVGSRVLVAVAPADGYGPQGGVKEAGIKADDTLLFVIDVQAQFPPRAVGEAVAPPAGLPGVVLAEDGKPTITVPAAEPPAQLLVQPLIKGAGQPVVAGQTITAMYTGIKWADGSTFDSSWERMAPAEFPIGTGGVIAGWDTALVGQPVGSQVLIVVPPAEGYGAEGNPKAGITGTDTLVFLVDVLDAR